MDWFQLVQHGRLVHRSGVAAAAPRAPMLVQHPMSPARVVFLAVLVAFFCALFIGTYIWMRRPEFGQVGPRQARIQRDAVQKGPVRSPSAPVS